MTDLSNEVNFIINPSLTMVPMILLDAVCKVSDDNALIIVK